MVCRPIRWIYIHPVIIACNTWVQNFWWIFIAVWLLIPALLATLFEWSTVNRFQSETRIFIGRKPHWSVIRLNLNQNRPLLTTKARICNFIILMKIEFQSKLMDFRLWKQISLYIWFIRKLVLGRCDLSWRQMVNEQTIFLYISLKVY